MIGPAADDRPVPRHSRTDIDAALSPLQLNWPLYEIDVDAERNAEAHWTEPRELNVVFDDVSGHYFDEAIDRLAEELDDRCWTAGAERADREHILVLTPPSVPVALIRPMVKRLVARRMRTAVFTP